ncbi:hypothetical protein K443DRAFT_653001 [Laccaria amethystina LaAM-08-1]|uniref:Uncharacterized protein n=1 Tax=Laccaria amethystina LaAM-08-1 TaxID=1095629 RepID=A0A0C9Y0T2_9AGAR|nr:hypothetical protein K443DRAFT_653001 [Laccaria amethystina LaAM-08-1]
MPFNLTSLAPLLIIAPSLTSRQYYHDKTSKHAFESHGSSKSRAALCARPSTSRSVQ